MAFQTAGNVGLAVRVGAEIRSLGRKTRSDLNADPSDVSGIRGIVDQLMASELHVGNGNALAIMDTSGVSVATFNSSGAHSIGKAGQDVTFDGNVVVTGNISWGTSSVFNGTNVNLGDNIITVNSGPSGSKNAGLAAQRYQVANNLGTGDVVNDTAAVVASLSDIGDQTGQDSTHIYLGASASGTDDYYVGLWLKSAFADGQNVRLISAYNGTTKIATLASAWDTQPSSNSAVGIYSPYTSLIYSESLDRWQPSLLTGPAAGDAVLGALDFGVASLYVTNDAIIGAGNAVRTLSGTLIVAGGNAGGSLSLRANGKSTANGIDITNGSGVVVYQAVIPDSDSARNLGSSSAAFATAYVDTITSLTANDRIKLGTDSQVLVQFPVIATADIGNIATPAAGDVYFDSTLHALRFYDDNAADWVTLGAGGGGGGSLDDAYNTGSAITVDTGPVALTQAKTTENGGTLTIAYAASAFTGTAHGIVVDFSGASSLSNGSDVYGLKLVGVTNAGAGNSVGLRLAGFDVGIENTGTLAQSGASTFTGNVSQTTGTYTYNVGASAFSVDSASFSLDSTSASNVSVTGGNLGVGTLTSGDLSLYSAGGASLEASGGAITIGGNADAQAINIGTGAAARTITLGNVTGATAIAQSVGTGGWSVVEAGLSNSATNAPEAANDAVFLLSDGLSKADAASFSTCFVKGAYTGTSGQCKKGTKLVFTKMFTNAGGTTYDDIAKGALVYLAVASANAYDPGVTPAKARVTNRTTSAAGVTFLVGVATAPSGTGTSTVTVDFAPQYLGGN